MSVGALTALIIAITGLAGAIPAIIIAFRAKNTANVAQGTADSAHDKINTVVTMNALKRPGSTNYNQT
jgi:biopolymer transport protein ExbB/TolQ